MDEFGEKLLEELDYRQEARNIQVPGWRAFGGFRGLGSGRAGGRV